MELRRLQDRVDRGLGIAARQIGAQYDAFRPAGVADPLAPANRFLRLPAAFADETRGFRRPVGYGRALWSGIFDTAYTKPGDYLRGPSGTFFVAGQQSLLPNLCVMTTHTLSVSRPAAPSVAGVNGYGGLVGTTATTVLSNWPGAVLAAGAGAAGDLPGGGASPGWTMLLPVTPVRLATADLVRDEFGQAYVVGSAELTALGWRLLVRQAAA